METLRISDSWCFGIPSFITIGSFENWKRNYWFIFLKQSAKKERKKKGKKWKEYAWKSARKQSSFFVLFPRRGSWTIFASSSRNQPKNHGAVFRLAAVKFYFLGIIIDGCEFEREFLQYSLSILLEFSWKSVYEESRDSALPILSLVLIWFTQVNQTVIEFDSNVMDLSSNIIHWSIRFVFCSYVAKPTNFNLDHS